MIPSGEPGWLADLAAEKRAAPAAAVPVGDGPRYADLLPALQQQADRRLDAARERATTDLRALVHRSAAHGGWRDGDGWDDGVYRAACDLQRVARAPWSSPDPAAATEAARALVLAEAPRDDRWGIDQTTAKWGSALASVTRDGVTPWRASIFGGALPTDPDGQPTGSRSAATPPEREPTGEVAAPPAPSGDLSPGATARLRWLLDDREARQALARLDVPATALADHLLVGSDVETLQPSSPLVHGVLPRGAVVILYGESGLGKSTLALALARAVAAGQPVHSWDAEKGSVLLVSAEGAGGFAARSRALTAAHGLPTPDGAFVLLPRGVDLSDARQADELATITSSRKADLVVLDTLNATAGTLDENDAGDMGLYVARARYLVTDHGGTVIIVHHTGLTEKGRMRGSSALYAAADVVLRMSGNPQAWKLDVVKDKDGAHRNLGTFRTAPAHGAVVTERLDDLRGPLFTDHDEAVRDAVRSYLTHSPGATKQHVIAALRGEHGRNRAAKALEALITTGAVQVRQLGPAAHCYFAPDLSGNTP